MQFLDLPLVSHQEAFAGLCGVLGACTDISTSRAPTALSIRW